MVALAWKTYEEPPPFYEYDVRERSLTSMILLKNASNCLASASPPKDRLTAEATFNTGLLWV